MNVGYHHLSILRDGGQAFAAMIEAISKAQHSICLETYILRDDHTGARFGEALIERSRKGVEVNVLYDAWGSSVSVEYLAWLNKAGVRTMAFHPVELSGAFDKTVAKLTLRNHRKLLIVDGYVAFTGGLNISDDYAAVEDHGVGWRDTHIRIIGPTVPELLSFFLTTWKTSGGPPIRAISMPKPVHDPDAKVRVAASHLRRGRRTVRHAYGDAFRQAKSHIFITNAYFLPTVRLLQSLRHAAQRGVDVRVMVAGTTDVAAVLHASRAIYGLLLKSGVRLFEWEGRVLHAKTATIDRHWSTIGSSNLDRQSLRFNLEVNVIVEDAPFASAMETMFFEDLISCREITLDNWEKRSIFERGASWAAYLARDWL
ncbi:MAG: cardiolipin synthase ClsB [Polyangiaceae bacterium]|nr:cardiolipin synthase ClsB [Polyangiaceae bacterium]